MALEPYAGNRTQGIVCRELGGTRREVGGWRRGAGIWRREAGDIAQGAPQRALCDVWRREAGIGNPEILKSRKIHGAGTVRREPYAGR